MARRRIAVVLLLAVPVLATVGAACSSSKVAEEVPTTIPPSSSTPASVLPSTTTVPGTDARVAACAALTSALEVDELQPRNTGNWTAERQRILTDTASSAALYQSASASAPADLVAPLAAVVTYARFIGTAVSSAGSFAAAVTAVGAYPDKVGASMATAAVNTWKRQNCR